MSDPDGYRFLPHARDVCACDACVRWRAEQTCPAQTGPVWKLGGEPCGCTRPAGHDPRDGHLCSCGAWWDDSVRRDRPRGATGAQP